MKKIFCVNSNNPYIIITIYKRIVSVKIKSDGSNNKNGKINHKNNTTIISNK